MPEQDKDYGCWRIGRISAFWWPQGGGSADVENGDWKVTAFLGLPRDVGHQFEITARVFGEAGNKLLEQWVQETAKTGLYPGMPMPQWVGTCQSATVVVTKSG